MPDGRPPSGTSVVSYAAVEREDMVWVNISKPSSSHAQTHEHEFGFPDAVPELRSREWSCYDQVADYAAPYWNVIENLLDTAHLQFTHEGTQGRYIAPITDRVPQASAVKVTSWQHNPMLRPGTLVGTVNTNATVKPTNYRLVFEPPITVRLEVALPMGWKFHQMHYAIPLGPNKTRLLLRSLRNFFTWVPDFLIWSSNELVLNQDRVMLSAQQLRVAQGADDWAKPVAADQLALQYRRWANKAEEASKPWFRGYARSGSHHGVQSVARCCHEELTRDGRVEAAAHCEALGVLHQSESAEQRLRNVIVDLWPSEKARRDV
eukprot:jgi/Chlat1/4105/Chrsp26S08856